MTVRIGICGVSGRMGRLVAEEVLAAGGLLAGGTCRSDDAAEGVTVFADVAELAAASDVVIDFTVAAAVQSHAAALAAAGVAWVLGTTGLSAADEASVAAAGRQIPVLRAANFSPGVNLVLALAETLGAALPEDVYDAEIVEMHHRQKVDAPSGTALAIGHAVAAGRGKYLADVMVSGRHGHTGPRRVGEIGLAALRGGQVAGSHSLLLTAGAEQIVLTHHAFDRRVFATGAVRAALWLAGRPVGVYGMRDVLEL